MQNRLVVIVCSLLLSLPLYSQLHVGFKAGINYSKTHLIFNLQPTDLVKRINHPGLHISIPIEIPINELVALQPEFTFTTEGSIFYVYRPEEERIYNNLLHYLKLPILAKIMLIETKSTEISIHGGLTPAYAVGIKSTSYPQHVVGTVRTEPASFADTNTNRFDLSLNAGISLEKTIAKEIKMLLGARYNLGVYDIDNSKERTSFTESFYLSLGLLIPLKKIFKTQINPSFQTNVFSQSISSIVTPN